MPDTALESTFWKQGVAHVAGVDEAGRGCLAGPVVAAAVVLPPEAELPDLDDSKRLPVEARELLAGMIERQALAIGIGTCDPREIDQLNILWASMEAMRRALLNLALPAGAALVDGDREIPGAPCPQVAVIGGDGRSVAIAAASVIAKVTRDLMMASLDGEYPQYGFISHKGYATHGHYAALAQHGPTPHHRRSFRLE